MEVLHLRTAARAARRNHHHRAAKVANHSDISRLYVIFDGLRQKKKTLSIAMVIHYGLAR